MLRLEEHIGNLVLIDEENQIAWQCFAHPTNTILWGQQLKASLSLIVFPTNSSVYYSFETFRGKILAYINWRHNKYSYWQLEPQGNRTIAYMRLGTKGLKIFNKDSHKIAQILSDGTKLVRLFTIETDGNLEFYHYSMNLRRFKPSYKLLSLCDLPLACGLYGICSSQSTCRYLQPRSITEKINDIFEMGIYNGSCEVFGSEVGMVQLKGVETILRSQFFTFNTSEESCVTSCKENCSCDSVVYYDQERRCFQFGLVAGVREVYGENGQSFWVKMPKKKKDGESNDMVKKFVTIGGIVDLIAILIIITAVLYYCSRIRNKKVRIISSVTEIT
jgi:hypothetical protein